MVEGWTLRLVIVAAAGAALMLPAADTGRAASSSCDLSAGAYEGAGGPTDRTPRARYRWTPLQPAARRPANFDGGASSDPDGDPIVAYSWNFGDGSGTSFASTPATSHSFSAIGTYTVTLGVFDCRDGYGTVSARITVGAAAIAGTGTTATAALCGTRNSKRIRLPRGGGVRTLSVTVSQGRRKLRVYRAAKVRGSTLSINGAGLPSGKLTVTIRSRRGGRIVTQHRSLRVCSSAG